MRTGHNKLLFSDLGKADACTAPTCYQTKVEAHVAKAIAAKPKLVQISTAYGQQKQGSPTLPRNKYTEVRTDKPATKEEAMRPEFKHCKFTTEAIVSEGIDKGELRKVCTEPTCPVHDPKQRPQRIADDTKWKAEQEKQRKDAAIANTVGIRIVRVHVAIFDAAEINSFKRDGMGRPILDRRTLFGRKGQTGWPSRNLSNSTMRSRMRPAAINACGVCPANASSGEESHCFSLGATT